MSPDLRSHPPRRPSLRVDGIAWLPRLIDKARAYDAGLLGDYLFGQSPVDESFLRAAGIDYATMLEIARTCSRDIDVLHAIERRSLGARGRLRSWTEQPPFVCRLTFALVDADEGHGRGAARVVGVIPPVVYRIAVAALRRFKRLGI